MTNQPTFLLIFLCIFTTNLIAQSQDYYEFADHEKLFRNYEDMIPIADQSAYIFRNASLIRINGTTETEIYQNIWGCADTRVLYSGQDTIIFFYNYFDYDIGSDLVSKLTISPDSISLIGDINDAFSYGNPEDNLLYTRAHDFILDSLDQIIMIDRDGFSQVSDNMDTTRIANIDLPFGSKLFKNKDNDIFLQDDNLIYKVEANYDLTLSQTVNEKPKNILNNDESMYVLHEDEISIYDDQFNLLEDVITLDTDFGGANDFAITESGNFLVLQESDDIAATMQRYNLDGDSEILYEEPLEFTQYSKIRILNDRAFCVGNAKAAPLLKSQAIKQVVPDHRPDLFIQDIEITYDSTNRANCEFLCTEYFYDYNFTVQNVDSDTVINYNIGSFTYPLNTNSFGTIFLNYGFDTSLAAGDIHSGFAEYSSTILYNTFTFEIAGANFFPDRNPDNSTFVANDILADISKTLPRLEEVLLYPIPVQDQLNISSSEPIHTIQVYTIGGQLIYALQSENTIDHIDMKRFTAGAYLIQLWNKDKSKSSVDKVIIQ